MDIGQLRAFKKNERHVIGSLVGFALLVAVCFWHYVTVRDYYVESQIVPITLSTIAVILATILWGFLGIKGLGAAFLWYPYQLAVGSAFGYWVYYNLSNPAPAWGTALSWFAGASFAVFTIATTATAMISDGILRKIYVTVVLWSTLGFYVYTFMHVFGYYWKVFSSANVLDIILTVPVMLVAVAIGLFMLYLMAFATYGVPQYFICYFHIMRGPIVKLDNGKSCRVPLRFDNAYYAACSYKEGSKRGKVLFIAASIYCADSFDEADKKVKDAIKAKGAISNYEANKIRSDKRYRFPGGKEDKDIVAAVMKNAINAMKIQGNLVGAKEYAKQWVDRYWMGREKKDASVVDFYEMFKTWDEIDDGKPKDTAWLEKQRKKLAKIKEAEIEERQKRNYEEHKRHIEAEAERIKEAKEELRRQRLSAQQEKLQSEYKEKIARLDRAERILNFALDGRLYTNQENYVAGNLSADEYAMRDFVRDELERKYREDYERVKDRLENDDDEDDE